MLARERTKVPQPNLTTLDNVKAWLGSETTTDDLLLNRLIQQVSRFILSYLQRPSLFLQTYRDVYDGSGSSRIMLRQWPVLSVSSLTVGAQSISAAASFGQPGYAVSPWDGMPPGPPQSLDLNGYVFCRGIGNVAVEYDAGYAVQAEPQTVPAISNYSLAVDQPSGMWADDQGVTYADGTPMTAVTGDPSTGQYKVIGGGVYQFAAADAGAAVLISYSFVPSDIEEACAELVGYWYSKRTRIGLVSKAMAGETTTFSQKDMPDSVKAVLNPYRRQIPV